ncbi:MAG: Rho termination factor N-terminal domain-containing protein, partial [Propionibacteriaceae bacterium]|nr:Rho termination factor N-terminal domain-containing protein [Propionibacteriaceae bacterium]
MLLPELKQLAASMGIKTSGLRKGALVEAIKAAGGGNSGQRPARSRRGSDDGGPAESRAGSERKPAKTMTPK